MFKLVILKILVVVDLVSWPAIIKNKSYSLNDEFVFDAGSVLHFSGSCNCISTLMYVHETE